MNKIIILFVFLGVLLASCSPGQLFGPTKTVTSTITLTPTSTNTSTPTSTNTPTPTITPTATPTQIGGGSGKLMFELPDEEFKNLFPDLEGRSHVFTANLNGTDLTPVSTGLKGNICISDISPDGMKVLLLSAQYDLAEGDLFVLYLIDLYETNSEPTEIIRLDDVPQGKCQVAQWIDNRRFVYIGHGESGFGIYSSNNDGTQPKKIYQYEGTGEEFKPHRILFVNEFRVYWTAKVLMRQDGNRKFSEERIWWSAIDGSDYGKLEYNEQQITGHFSTDALAFSPDGSKLVWLDESAGWPDFKLYIASITDLNNPYELKQDTNGIDLAWFPEAIMIYSPFYYLYTDKSDTFGFYKLTVSPDLPGEDYSDLLIGLAQSEFNDSFCWDGIKDVSPDGKQMLLLPAGNASAQLLELDSMTISEVLPGIMFGFCDFFQINWVP